MSELWTEQENTFHMNIGDTKYEVSTHFDSGGRQSVLQQFQDLLLNSTAQSTFDSGHDTL